MTTHSYKDLQVWQKAMQLTELTYELVQQLPKFEQFSLADQMRRAAVSIPSNIAEGQKRLGKVELAHFCSIALGSAAELETQTLLCQRIYGLEIDGLLSSIEEISKMLTALIKVLRTSNYPTKN